MDAQFWHTVWEQNLLNFHLQAAHPLLQKYWPTLGVPAGGRVFVPLCGKSHDMAWLLQQGHPVLGVELSPIAVRDCFAENGLEPVITPHGRLTAYDVPDWRIVCGDFFDLTPADTADVAAAYDRAALYALPPELRPRYAAHTAALLPPGAHLLLFTFTYDQTLMSGPPFSVPEEEIHALYGGYFTITPLRATDIVRKTAFNLPSFVQAVYHLQK